MLNGKNKTNFTREQTTTLVYDITFDTGVRAIVRTDTVHRNVFNNINKMLTVINNLVSIVVCDGQHHLCFCFWL